MPTNNDDKSFFTQFIESGPEKEQVVPPEKIPRGPLLQPIVPPADRRSPPVEQLLAWLVNHWQGSTISVRNICQIGPRSTRNKKSAISLAETLVENGWLTPLKTRRRDMRAWQIARRPQQ